MHHAHLHRSLSKDSMAALTSGKGLGLSMGHKQHNPDQLAAMFSSIMAGEWPAILPKGSAADGLTPYSSSF